MFIFNSADPNTQPAAYSQQFTSKTLYNGIFLHVS